MGALQEARFYIIIGVIMLIGILAYFFNLQNNVGYTDYSTQLKTTYADVKANAATTKSLRDVMTLDGTNVRVMKNNQLFGLTLNGTPDDIALLDSYIPGTTTATDLDASFTGSTITSGKFNLSFLYTGDSPKITNVGTALGSASLDNLGELNTLITGGSGATLTSLERGWELDNNYLLYSFENNTVASKILNDYLPAGTLLGRHIIVPFQSK